MSTAGSHIGSTWESPIIALAQIGVVTGDNDQVAEWIDVHFNPASLQLQLTNELKDSENQERKQYVAKTSAKLTMDLQFDTTATGEDVTATTRKLQAFLLPERPRGESTREPPPPVVLFQWGTVKFKGLVESYRETIDFFAAEGVPLRAAVNLTISRQDKVFDEAPSDAPDTTGTMNSDLVETPASSASDLAGRGQSPGAARGIGAMNGQESLRFGAGATLGVSAGISLRGPVAMVSAGAGISAGIGGGLGIGAGAGAGIGIGGSAGIGLGASAGIGGGIGFSAGAGAAIGVGGGLSLGATGGFGASAGAGVGLSAGAGFASSASARVGSSASAGMSGLAGLSASEGAFAGLRVTTSSTSFSSFNTSRITAMATLNRSVSTSQGAVFQPGGRAVLSGSAGLRANVGAGSPLRGRLSFDVS